MNDSGSGGGKVFGRFTEPAHRVLDLARAEAERFGRRLLGVGADARQPADMVWGSRRHRQIIAHVGLPEGYRGAAGRPLLAVLGIDLDLLVAAVTAELGGVQR
jgi:hypothetical protein